MSITKSHPQNITSPSGNSLAIYKDSLTNILYLKDINGIISPITDSISAFNRRLFSQTADGINITNTTDETNLLGTGEGTLSVPPNSFQVGYSYNFKIGGVISTNGGAETIQIRVDTSSGGVAVPLADSGLQNLTVLNNETFILDLNFTIREVGGVGTATILTYGSMFFPKSTSGSLEGFEFRFLEDTNFDTTIAQTILVTAQWGDNKITNSIQSQYATLVQVY
jgi:hypothetical protein